MQNFRFTIAALETKRFELAGRYLEIIESQGPVTINLSDKDGGRGDAAANVRSGTFMASPFTGIEVFSATAQTVELFITETSGGTRRQPGTVNVVDGERDKVQQGVCFSGVADVPGAAGSGRVQVWNPAGSGRLVFVTAVTLGSSVADSWGLWTTTSQLGTAAPNAPQNHDSSGAGPVAALLRTDNTGVALAGVKTYRAGYVQASADRVVVLPRPLLLRPGVGAVAYLNNVAASLRASFEFEEWPA